MCCKTKYNSRSGYQLTKSCPKGRVNKMNIFISSQSHLIAWNINQLRIYDENKTLFINIKS